MISLVLSTNCRRNLGHGPLFLRNSIDDYAEFAAYADYAAGAGRLRRVGLADGR
jgi:hypothetical protein